MNRTFPDSAILLIDRDPATTTQLQDDLRESFGVVETANCLTDAVEMMTDSNFSLVVCELGLVVANRMNCPITTAFLDHQSSIILQSAHQHAAVRFQQFSGQSFYCLKKSVCSDLIPVIASLAGRMTRRPATTHRLFNPPHFALPLSAENPALNSNIHSMY